ncbi:MAG: hypothetical protein ACRC2U_02290, partial [Aeromonas sp.]
MVCFKSWGSIPALAANAHKSIIPSSKYCIFYSLGMNEWIGSAWAACPAIVPVINQKFNLAFRLKFTQTHCQDPAAPAS